MMTDRRIVRGNTYAAQIDTVRSSFICIESLSSFIKFFSFGFENCFKYRRHSFGCLFSSKSQTAVLEAPTMNQTKKRATPTTNSTRLPASSTNAPRSRTPEPVYGRKHIDIQTDNYLEELTDKPQEEDAATQTDAVMDRFVLSEYKTFFLI
jgi:hypothetical protein